MGGSKNLKAIVIKGDKQPPRAGQQGQPARGAQEDCPGRDYGARERDRPRKGGLSVYGTNVLMNMTSNIGGLPVRNAQFTCVWRERAS